jgi:hypothetical protein
MRIQHADEGAGVESGEFDRGQFERRAIQRHAEILAGEQIQNSVHRAVE